MGVRYFKSLVPYIEVPVDELMQMSSRPTDEKHVQLLKNILERCTMPIMSPLVVTVAKKGWSGM